MFRAWKDTILSHCSLISGKGLKNEKHRFSNDLSHPHSKLFPCTLQPHRRPTPEKFWAIERGRLRPFVLRSCFAHMQSNNCPVSSHFKRAHYRVRPSGLSNQLAGFRLRSADSLVPEMLT